MAKLADYFISAVRYDDDHEKIIKVRRHKNINNSVGEGSECTRSSVVSDLQSGITYSTITKNSNGNWDIGADIHIVYVNSVAYIRTDRNNTPKDNLENLPEF